MNVKKYGLIIAVGMVLTMGCGVGHAQYYDWRGLKAAFTTEVFQAPVPENAAARAAAFAERNSPSNLTRLAQQFFSLMDRGMMPEKARERIDKQQWIEALAAYRDFFVERLRFPPPTWTVGPVGNWGFPLQPKPPAQRVFWTFYNTADNLMSNIVLLSVNRITEWNVTTSNVGILRVNIGQPGQVNWTWTPPGYKYLGYWQPNVVDAPMSYSTAQPDFFNVLLTEYLNTGEKRYLDKWTEFSDDRFMNWRADSAKAGFVPIGWNDTEAYTRGFIPQLEYLARIMPGFDKDLSPATLARELMRVWIDYVPRNIRSPRHSAHNRRIGIYGQHLLYMALLCPEFRPAQYCLQEFRRLVEAFPTVEMLPDGSDMEVWLNYNYSTPRWWFPGNWSALRQMNYLIPSWATPEWQTELFAMCERRGSYLVHRLLNTGSWPHPGSHGSRENSGKVLFAHEAAEGTGKIDPENRRIRNALFDGGRGVPPSFHSEAFPYVGYYYLRNGWNSNDLCLFMPSTPPGLGLPFPYNNSITLCAYGQDLLRVRWDTPIMVDDCPQIHCETYLCYPREMRLFDYAKPIYGKESPGANTALHTPLKNRWLDSTNFAFCEGTYAGPYASYKPDSLRPWQGVPDKFIDGITHQRQVVLLKKAGLYVVTDRVRSAKPHEYALCWSIVGPTEVEGEKKTGFTHQQVVLDDKNQTIKTCNPDSANLSLYHVSAQPLKLTNYSYSYIGCIQPTYGGRFKEGGNQFLTTVIYPRRTIKDELAGLKRLAGDNPAINGFEAALPDGTRVLYKSAQERGRLQCGNVTIDGEALLVTLAPNGECHGIALGCKEFKTGWWNKAAVPGADFEFSLPSSVFSLRSSAPSFTPILRPLDMVTFEPQADCFTNEVTVSMHSADPGVEIRYTLDGAEPDGFSSLYTEPVVLRMTTTVKARAFRKGVMQVPTTVSGDKVSAVQTAVYTQKAPLEPVKLGALAPGLIYAYFEENPWQLSAYIVDVINPVKSGVASELFDISAKGTNGVYAFVYRGYLDIPADGIYSFHAPPEFIFPVDSGYDLRVSVGREEWYPATRWHNFGAWSVPLQKGKYPFGVVWVDQRKQDVYVDGEWRAGENLNIWNGEKPALMISGPGLAKQPIPAKWLWH